ncbi:hypothetical protein BLA34_22005 [Ralstonia solanacearum]|nr:hypothetical protein BLA34_22005 [Ralstonia solanacearum]
MAVTGVSRQQYETFMRSGGTLTFRVEAHDIDNSDDGAFEQSPTIQPRLHTGFEIPPTSLIMDDPKAYAEAWLHGDLWTRVIVRVYSQGGKIVYRKVAQGQYDAEASF